MKAATSQAEAYARSAEGGCRLRVSVWVSVLEGTGAVGPAARSLGCRFGLCCWVFEGGSPLTVASFGLGDSLPRPITYRCVGR
jgi:hypothetical protein